MSEDLPPACCDDRSTWRHKGDTINLPHLLELIEKNGSPQGLDLHGADLSELDARPEALRPYVNAYAQKHGTDAEPPWLSALGTINLNFAHLENASLLGAHLENAVLEGANLENAFLVAAYLEGARLDGARLDNAMLGSTHLENAHLGDAHLKHARVWAAHLENAVLCDAHLENAVFAGAYLENAFLLQAHLENAVLEETRLSGAVWYGCFLDRTRLHRELLGQAIGDELCAKGRAILPSSFHHAREAYLGLKTNFDSIGRYDDASWAYVKEQQMEKAMYFPTTAGHKWIREYMHAAVPPPWWGPRHVPRWLWWKLRSAFYHARLFFGFLGLCPREVRQSMGRRDERGQEHDEWLSRRRWARNWAFELLTGYGEWPHMPVIWAIVVVLLFAVIYAAAGNIASGDGGGTHTFLTALTHSIGAFVTIGFNTLEPQGWGARLLTALEAMLGIGLFALFVFTLGNRMRRS